MNTPEMIPLQVNVQHPPEASLTRVADAARELVESFQITDDATFTLAGEELQSIQRRAATLNEQRMAITRPMDEAKARVMALFRGPVEALEGAARSLKAKMLTYTQEVQRRADEERAAALRAQEEERRRLEALAAQQQAAGRVDEAVATEARAAAVVSAPVVAPAAPPKVAGVKVTTTVDFEVTDIHALVRHVAEHPELVGLLTIDTVKVRAHVKSLGMLCKTPGLRVFEKGGVSASRK